MTGDMLKSKAHSVREVVPSSWRLSRETVTKLLDVYNSTADKCIDNEVLTFICGVSPNASEVLYLTKAKITDTVTISTE